MVRKGRAVTQGLAVTALTFTLAGARAAALEGGKQLLKLSGELRRDRPGYEQALDRLEHRLAALSREDQLSPSQRAEARQAATNLFRQHSLNPQQLAELDLDPHAAAECLLRATSRLLDREVPALQSEGLDGPTEKVCRQLVLACYEEILNDKQLLVDREQGVQVEVLRRTGRLEQQLRDLPDRITDVRSGTPVGPLKWPLTVGATPAAAVALQPRRVLRDQVTAHAGAAILFGDGGVGKSQLAAALFRDAARDGVDLRVWINGSDRASLVAGLANLATWLQLPQATSSYAEDAAAAARDYLTSTNKRWLVVYDDVTDVADVAGLWPQSSAGRMIITSRRTDLALAGAMVVKVGVFTAEESLHYITAKLNKSARRPNVLDEAAELAEDLGHLPLALAQATAVIETDGTSCAGYRQLLADETARLDELFPDVARADDYPRTVLSAWSLAIDRANSLEPRQIPGLLLRVAAFLDPNGIPAGVFMTPAIHEYLRATLEEETQGEWREGLAVEARHSRRALGHLVRFSLASRDEAGGPIRVHSLVQRATRHQLSRQQHVAAVVAAADAVLQAWPTAEAEQPAVAALRRNAAVLEQHPDNCLYEHQAHRVLFRAMHSLNDAGQLRAAIDMTDRLLERCLRYLGPDHPDTLAARQNIANVRGAAGDPSSAVAELEQVVTDELRVLGSDHPATLIARSNLARWRGVAGDPARAVDSLEQLLPDLIRVLGPDAPQTLVTRSNLAFMRGETGDPAGAVSAFVELVQARCRVLGSDHPETLGARGNLARWRGEAGDLSGAINDYEQLLQDQLRLLGPDHPGTLMARSNLTYLKAETGDPAGAAGALEELLVDLVRVLGPDHPETLAVRANLAQCHAMAGDPARGAAEYEVLLADEMRVLGPDHPSTLVSRANLSRLRGLMDDPLGAAIALEELLVDLIRVLGVDHPETLVTRGNLAHWHGLAGDPAVAAAELQQLLADQLKSLAPTWQDPVN